jgi:NADH:ubiquinone reductase (non-electrogenic)
MSTKPKKKLIILGSGFAAYGVIKKIDLDLYDVVNISPRNHFLFTPLLPSTTVGTIAFRSIIEPMRSLKKIRFFMGECLGIDFDNKKVKCIDKDSGEEFEFGYDYLVIGVGEITNTFGIENVAEYAYYLRELSDARKIRVKIIDCFEDANLPGLTEEEIRGKLRFVICGGGPTGVEFAAELNDLIEDDIKKKYPELMKYTEIILVDAAEKILSSFSKKLSEYTMKVFNRAKIQLKMNSIVTGVEKDYITLKDGTEIKYSMLIWAAGNAPLPFIKETPFERDKRGKIITDQYFRIPGYDDIFAIGDCSEIKDTPLPATAQVAQSEGYFLGKFLNRKAKGKESKPFRFKDLGMMAYIGSNKALADTPQFKGSGFNTWLFWRSAYLTKLVGLRNKIHVLFDWIMTSIFGRDLSNF